MKSYLTRSIIAAFAGLAIACSASALTLSAGSTNFLGYIIDGNPSSPTDEAAYITALNGLALNGSGPVLLEMAYRSGNSFATSPTPVFSSKNDQTPADSFLVTGLTYVIAKYGNYPNQLGGQEIGQATLVWNVVGLTGSYDVSPTGGLSHVSLFGSPRVPDGGSTIALLGLGLALLAVARRKLA